MPSPLTDSRARLALGLLGAALALAVSGACRRDSGPPSGAAPAGDTLAVAVGADVTGVFPNPPMTNDSYSLDVNSNVFEGLVTLDAQLVPRPALAESWENPDARTWVFHLRHDVHFSDGTPVTAADVVASLTAAREKGWCNAGALQSIAAIAAVDPATVRIETRIPFPNLLARLHYGFVLPAWAVGRTPVPPVGTGPYAVERWLPGRTLTLVRNPSFRRPRPFFQRIELEVVADDAERVGRVVSGRAQLANGVPIPALAQLERERGVRQVVAPGLRVVHLAFRVDAAPFSDRRLREAVDLAIDREELIRRVLRGQALPASQLVTAAVAGYNPALRPVRPDRDRARQLVAQAGPRGGLRVTLDGPRDWYVEDAAIMAEVARQLATVGIRVEVNALPKRDWIPRLQSGRSRFYLYGWACETRDAGDALDALIHSPTPEGLGLNNYQGVSDAVLDGLIDQANLVPPGKPRNAIFATALARVAELHAIVPLEIQPESVAMRDTLSWTPPLNFGLRLLETARLEREP